MRFLTSPKVLLVVGILFFLAGVYTQSIEWIGDFFGFDLAGSEKTIRIVSAVCKVFGTAFFVSGVYIVSKRKREEKQS